MPNDTAKVRNISGEDLLVGWLNGRLVLDGQAVEVPLEDVYAYTQQTQTWEPYDNAAKKAHKEARTRPTLERHEAELAALEPDPPAESADEHPVDQADRRGRPHPHPGGLTDGHRIRTRCLVRHRRRVHLRRAARVTDVAVARHQGQAA
jgi:hypothetical protein